MKRINERIHRDMISRLRAYEEEKIVTSRSTKIDGKEL